MEDLTIIVVVFGVGAIGAVAIDWSLDAISRAKRRERLHERVVAAGIRVVEAIATHGKVPSRRSTAAPSALRRPRNGLRDGGRCSPIRPS
jgi:hypothetical protein